MNDKNNNNVGYAIVTSYRYCNTKYLLFAIFYYKRYC